jgi:short-subunit dehydrogenase
VVDEIKNTYTKFDALINCAGVPSIQKPNAITYNELEDLMKVNTMAPIFLTSQLFDLIKENEADIVNIGSTQGLKQGRLNCCAYVTSKWALRGTSQNLQLELANTRCRVIQFNVGGMNTKMHYKYNGEIIENPDEWMQPKDVASLMLYLLRLPKQLEVGEIAINRKKL